MAFRKKKYFEIKYNDGSLYQGEADEDKEPHGYGRMNYDDGGWYEGNWSHGKAEGPGKQFVPGMGTLEGYYTDDLFDGDFTITFENGVIFRGRITRGTFDRDGGLTGVSEGELLFTAGGRYRGGVNHFFAMDGTGTFTEGGASYTGTWKNGRLTGRVTAKYPDGGIVTGFWGNPGQGESLGYFTGEVTVTEAGGEAYSLRVGRDGKPEGPPIMDRLYGINLEILFGQIDQACFSRYKKAGRIEFRADSVWYKTDDNWTGPLTLISTYSGVPDSKNALESIAKAYYNHRFEKTGILIRQGKEVLDMASYDTYEGYGRVSLFWELKW